MSGYRVFNKKFVKNYPILCKNFELETILEPTRNEDKGDDVWSVYNVIQEKLVNGLLNYGVGAKVRKARKIQNFQQDMKLNQDLYELALSYA